MRLAYIVIFLCPLTAVSGADPIMGQPGWPEFFIEDVLVEERETFCYECLNYCLDSKLPPIYGLKYANGVHQYLVRFLMRPLRWISS